jgi:hypothetical protein
MKIVSATRFWMTRFLLCAALAHNYQSFYAYWAQMIIRGLHLQTCRLKLEIQFCRYCAFIFFIHLYCAFSLLLLEIY